MNTLTYDELLELRLCLCNRFDVVWKRYRDMCRLREYTDDAIIQSFRDDVLLVISIIRKTDLARVNH